MSINYAQMGLNVAKGTLSYMSAKADAKMAAMTQKYNNAMQAISTAASLNAQTSNEIGVRDAGVQAGMNIKLQSLQDRASATVSAAAAGVHGASVDSAMRGMMRSKLQASAALKENLAAQGRGDLNNRRNILMGAAYSKDVSVIGRPSAASALLGIGLDMFKTYDANQPKGQQAADTLAKWGRK
jgi:hypothetical protein